MATWAIVAAGGTGSRFGAPKQFELLGGVPIVERSVRTAAEVCDGVVLVVPSGAAWEGPPVDRVVVGGATRADSVRAGLAAVPDDADVVVVHDAARPLATAGLFVAVVEAVRAGADAAVPAVAVADTVKRVEGIRVVETLDRDRLVAVQTPQAFRASALRAAHAGDPEATDDAALVEERGGTVEVVAGDPRNRKVTTPDDLVAAAALDGTP